jgi:hypothetical protein
MMKDELRRKIDFWSYQVEYLGSLCRWFVNCVADIPEYKPPGPKSVKADFADSHGQRSAAGND